MRSGTKLKLGMIAVLLLASLAYCLYVGTRSFSSCPVAADNGPLEKTVEALERNVELGLTLSTTLAGLGAALLLGLKEGVRLRPVVKLAIFLATIFFAQSALYGVWWRFGVAESWLNDCPGLVAEDLLQSRFEAHVLTFILGLLCFLLLTAASIFDGTGKPARVASTEGKRDVP
jgi:hypothetical protein